MTFKQILKIGEIFISVLAGAADRALAQQVDIGPGETQIRILNARYRRVGVGLVVSGNKLYLTNDVSQ